MWFSTSSGIIELKLTKAQAAIGSHSGSCDADIAQLHTVPAIRRQLDKLRLEIVAAELDEFGTWEPEELANHDENLSRLCGLHAAILVKTVKHGAARIAQNHKTLNKRA